MRAIKEVLFKNRFLVAMYLLTGITIAFFDNFCAGFYEMLIDRFSDGTLKGKQIAIYGMALLLLCLVNYIDEYPAKKLEHGMFLDFKLMALRKMSTIDYEASMKLGTGKLVQQIENGAEAGKGILFDFYFCVFRELLPSAVFSITFILRISRKVTLVLLAGYVLVFLVTKMLLSKLYQMKEKILCNEEILNHYLVRGFMELLVFRVYKRFGTERRKAEEAKKEIVDAKVRMNLIHEAFFTIFALLITAIKIGILVYGWKTGEITIGAIIALLALVDHAYTPVAIFNVLFVQFKLDKMAFERFDTFLEEKDDVQLENGDIVSQVDGQITMDGVAFSYGNRSVIEGMNFTINKGEKIAFVGESGAGKSTIVKLLLGLLKPSHGKIAIDGMDTRKLCLNSLYDSVRYIPQESPIFDGTLRENLVFDQDVTDERIIWVLKKVKLFSWYEALENGLDTMLGEKGITLSGGERQRLALARLWFGEHKIVILDEASSAMDSLTKESVMTNVREELKDSTVIAIEHGGNSLQEYDRVFAFQDGQLKAAGDFKQLMTENGYFKELYEADLAGKE